jgi:hypothetical protein
MNQKPTLIRRTFNTAMMFAFARALTASNVAPALAQNGRGSDALAPDETRQIAEEAFIYGFPMVMNYAVFYDYFIDQSSPAFKAPLNQIWNAATYIRRRTPQSSRPTATRRIRSSAWTCGRSRT